MRGYFFKNPNEFAVLRTLIRWDFVVLGCSELFLICRDVTTGFSRTAKHFDFVPAGLETPGDYLATSDTSQLFTGVFAHYRFYYLVETLAFLGRKGPGTA